MAEQTATVEAATNYHHTRRHYSLNLAPSQFHDGREGIALCKPGGIPVTVYDDAAINAQLRQWRQGKPSIVVANLPECKSCVRAKAKREAGRG